MATNRIANVNWMHAYGAQISWFDILLQQVRWMQEMHPNQLENPNLQKLQELLRSLKIKNQRSQIHLRWSCSEQIGVPNESFTVWARKPSKYRLEEISLDDFIINGQFIFGNRRLDGNTLHLGGVAAVAICQCKVINVNQAAAVYGRMNGVNNAHEEIVAVDAQTVTDSNAVFQLQLRSSGMNNIQLENVTILSIAVSWLRDVVNDDNWQPIERVGLPVEKLQGTVYDGNKQGMMATLTDGVSAAKERLSRGMPPIGWWPLTATGRVAPTWNSPDPDELIKEVQNDLIENVKGLYRSGLTLEKQVKLARSKSVDSPSLQGKSSSVPATADFSLFHTLMLAASSDVNVSLAAGFGTAYGLTREHSDTDLLFYDFMVTAPFSDTPDKAGPSELAAFIPFPNLHNTLQSPQGLRPEPAGFVAPNSVDQPWAESVRLIWSRNQVTAAMERPTEGMLLRYVLGGNAVAQPLVAKRDAGDYRPYVLSANGLANQMGYDEYVLADAAAEIVIGSGGRSVGYAVAVQDIFGIWSRWADVPYHGTEPPPQAPRILRMQLDSQYAGNSICPAVLSIEMSIEWAHRTPTAFELALVFFPMSNANAAPPLGLSPLGVPPAGSFTRNLILNFSGDVLNVPSGVRVVYLNGTGDKEVTAGAKQVEPLSGQEPETMRRYRLEVDVPTLDFSGTPRWGVELWARTHLAVGVSPSAWSPDSLRSPIPDAPALAQAASPVPPTPLPLPPLPGVPIGSTLDAQGCSHVNVKWSFAAGADVKRVVIWEVAETALRQFSGLSTVMPNVNDGGNMRPPLMGERLDALSNAYNAIEISKRRNAFRRLMEVDVTTIPKIKEQDIQLPKGTKDIHLFAITAISSTGVESPWPTGNASVLQAVAAPRLVQPNTPRLNAYLVNGRVKLEVKVQSDVLVKKFDFYRTTLPEAARKISTMGPAFFSIAASDIGFVAGSNFAKNYAANAEVLFPENWDDWLVSAVACPDVDSADALTVRAQRGLRSDGSPVVSVSVLPKIAPQLQPLMAKVWGADHTGVLIQTSTTAPNRVTSQGSHSISGLITMLAPLDLPPVKLDVLEFGETQNVSAPPVFTTPKILQGPRASGSSPIGLWLKRSQASDQVTVKLSLTDPLGRSSTQEIIIPAWVDASPTPTLELVDIFSVAGRGVVIRIRSDADFTAFPQYILRIASKKIRNPRGIFGAPLPLSNPIIDVPLVDIKTNSNLMVQGVSLKRENLRSPYVYQIFVKPLKGQLIFSLILDGHNLISLTVKWPQ